MASIIGTLTVPDNLTANEKLSLGYLESADDASIYPIQGVDVGPEDKLVRVVKGNASQAKGGFYLLMRRVGEEDSIKEVMTRDPAYTSFLIPKRVEDKVLSNQRVKEFFNKEQSSFVNTFGDKEIKNVRLR